MEYNATNLTIDTNNIISPFDDPLGFCGVVESAINQHYQTMLTNYYVFFMIGGILIGFILGYIYFTYKNPVNK